LDGSIATPASVIDVAKAGDAALGEGALGLLEEHHAHMAEVLKQGAAVDQDVVETHEDTFQEISAQNLVH